MENIAAEYFVKTGQFTKTTYRDVYPSVEPTAASNSQAGKVIVITGASKGIGRVETNARGTFLFTQGLLKLLGQDGTGSIINMTSGMAVLTVHGMSSYSLSKLAALQLQAYVALENPNMIVIALHPGIVMTEMTAGAFEPFAKCTPELVEGLGVWLSTGKAAFLNGRYVSSNWSVDDLVARKEEIVSEGKLSLVLKGEFGEEQFP
ncbi:Short chain dehydrogenase [Lachnellula arida]|uniref:Short chain dehydrogenase n=1 Tax=Lachnellula arida TaxID=1316785 RepID=A0A8T9BDI3_9HELO|nr:Short chain dehydrogenase [Lachnellula arida]